MSESVDTKAYNAWAQNKIIRENISKALNGKIKFRVINVELCYLQGYIDGLADSGELGYLRYDRLRKLIEAQIKRNREEGEERGGDKNIFPEDK